MFPEKKQHWIDGPFFYYIPLKSWNDLIISRPEKAHHWIDYRPIFWNFHTDEDGIHEIQILYLKPDGPVNMLEIRVIVVETDEPSIRAWLIENGLSI